MLLGDGAGRVDTFVHQRSGELALEACGQRDQTLTALAEELLVHARPVVVALEVGRGHERHQVLVAGEVLGEEHEVERLAVAFGSRVAVETALPRDVRFDAHDRLDAGVPAKRVEVDRAVERAVIGERQSGHIERLRAGDEVGEPRQPVEQAVLAMGVQMDELLSDDLPHVAAREARRLEEVYGQNGFSTMRTRMSPKPTSSPQCDRATTGSAKAALRLGVRSPRAVASSRAAPESLPRGRNTRGPSARGAGNSRSETKIHAGSFCSGPRSGNPPASAVAIPEMRTTLEPGSHGRLEAAPEIGECARKPDLRRARGGTERVKAAEKSTEHPDHTCDVDQL